MLFLSSVAVLCGDKDNCKLKNKIMKELLSALANVKKEGTLSKTATNPFFKSKYFDINSLIEQVDPLLEKWFAAITTY
jgi:hypothetical protein